METKKTKFLQIAKNIKSPDFIYLSVFSIFLITVLLLFVFTTNFIVQNVNKIFTPASDGNTEALDIKNYLSVAKRLNLPVESVAVGVAGGMGTAVQQVLASTTATSSEPTRQSVSINILNSTNKSGSATALSKVLENAGFPKSTTGNQKKRYPITTILIKDSAKTFSDTLKNLVRNSYPKAITTVAPKTAVFDITIIIGDQ